MNRQEVNRLLAILKANYSYAFKTLSTQEKRILVESWAFALREIDADIVMMAVMRLLKVCKWMPTVAEIRDEVKKIGFDAEVSLLELGWQDETLRRTGTVSNLAHSKHADALRSLEQRTRGIDSGTLFADLLGDGRYADCLPESDEDETEDELE